MAVDVEGRGSALSGTVPKMDGSVAVQPIEFALVEVGPPAPLAGGVILPVSPQEDQSLVPRPRSGDERTERGNDYGGIDRLACDVPDGDANPCGLFGGNTRLDDRDGWLERGVCRQVVDARDLHLSMRTFGCWRRILAGR